jgi:hypothetical protein
MNRAPDRFAPSWLPRQQRRRVDRQLRKLFHRNACSFCGEGFKHNHPSAAGFDAQGNVAVACESCFDRLAKIFGMGLYSDRHYDFLMPRGSEAPPEVPPERIAEALEAYVKTISDTDKLLADLERRGGGVRAPNIVTQNHPWKSDDRDWFQRNQSRSHRARLPFPGEIDEEAIKASAERALVMLVRQIAPGSRLRAVVELSVDLLPVPDDEAVLHALFEVGRGREAAPRDREAFSTLIKKYQVSGAAS